MYKTFLTLHDFGNVILLHNFGPGGHKLRTKIKSRGSLPGTAPRAAAPGEGHGVDLAAAHPGSGHGKRSR